MIISIIAQKGGTGKTTTTAILGQAYSSMGKKVLAIDLDPQGNLSYALGANQSRSNSYELIMGNNITVFHTEYGLDVIPASMNLVTIKTEKGSARRLQKALEPLKGEYDYILIDTPPTSGEIQYNALQASDTLLIPLQADIYNLHVLYQIVDTAKQIMNTNKALTIKGFIITKLDNRSTIAKQMKENIIIAANKMNIPYLGSIRSGIAVQEAAAVQKSIYNYAPKSNPAIDYLALAKII